VKHVAVIGVCLMLAGTGVLAQSGFTRAAGLPAAQELQMAGPHVPHGLPFTQRQRARHGARALSARSRRRNAKALNQAGPEQVLYAFQGGNDGEYASSGLIFDSSGNLYGTTEYGGGRACVENIYDGCGTVFELTPNGSGGWTETILHSFQGGSDGQYPLSGLIFDQAGNLYGTTSCAGGSGGSCGGTVFELSPNGNGGWTESILHSFNSASDGAIPLAGLIFDQAGNLYGTTNAGGSQGYGTVFELSPNGSGGWTETILYGFQGGSNGEYPTDGLIFDQAGNLYGTTYAGGNVGCGNSNASCGTVFELSPNGSGGWTQTVIYTFKGGSDGGNPYAGLIFDQAGNLYGTAVVGGSAGTGTIFELSPNGSGGWTQTVLHSFQGVSDGAFPEGGVILDQAGNLYGTTSAGGYSGGSGGYGTVFELSPNGSGGWTETILYGFQGGSDGRTPYAGLIFDQTGHLYGTTSAGGFSSGLGVGVAYEVLKEPFAAFSPTNLGFSDQPPGAPSNPKVITLTNSGRLPLTITSIQIAGANSGDFAQTNNCPASLAPFNSCKIGVTFTPMAGGNRAAELQVADNAPGSPQTVALSGTGEDFSLAVTSQASMTVTPGQAANYAIAVSPVNLAQKVALSCSGAPPQSTCTISPSSVTLDGFHSAPASVAVVTSGASAGLTQPAGGLGGNNPFALWVALSGVLSVALLMKLGRCRREWPSRLLCGVALLCLLSFGVAMSACGGGGGSGGGGTPAGTYNLTVTGAFTSGSTVLKHALPLTLVVQ
jgi:uncharacterized repeat protein (TIGR03803 family)